MKKSELRQIIREEMTIQEGKWTPNADKLHNGIVKTAKKIWGNGTQMDYDVSNGTGMIVIYDSDG